MPLPFVEEFPSRSEIVKSNRKPSDVFTTWMEQGLMARVNESPVSADFVTELLEDQSAGVAGTVGGLQTSGFYVLTIYNQIIAVDPVANSLQLTVTWTFRGQIFNEVFPALTSIVVGAAGTRQGLTYPLMIDANTSISYSYAYASNTPGAMRWQGISGLTLLKPIGS